MILCKYFKYVFMKSLDLILILPTPKFPVFDKRFRPSMLNSNLGSFNAKAKNCIIIIDKIMLMMINLSPLYSNTTPNKIILIPLILYLNILSLVLLTRNITR